MRMHENFTRCECGEAWIEKKEYILGTYVKNEFMVPQKIKTVFVCTNCNQTLHTETKGV